MSEGVASDALENARSGALEPGPRSLLDQLYKHYWRDLTGYIFAKYGGGPPEPEDVAQTAFARFASLNDPTAVDNPKAFLFATARNIVVDEQRRMQTRQRHAEEFLLADASSGVDDLNAERVLLEKERWAVLRSTIEDLPQPQRRLVILSRVHQLSYAEISRQTGVPATTVKRHVADAMAACVEAISKASRLDGNDG